MLPARRKPFRSNILRGPRRIWQRHRKFVRSFQCCVPGCEQGPIEFAHVRTAANAGKSLKPHDAFAVALCSEHHRLSHSIGDRSFERRFGIDLMKLAAEFARRSPDLKMKESMKEEGFAGFNL